MKADELTFLSILLGLLGVFVSEFLAMSYGAIPLRRRRTAGLYAGPCPGTGIAHSRAFAEGATRASGRGSPDRGL
jgi:hypothetical protein